MPASQISGNSCCWNCIKETYCDPIPPEGILPEQYYAVEYVETYYIGHALSQADSFVRFKFLHRVGAKSFDWPRRDDVDDVHISCVFYGPVTLESAGPFAVPKQQNIEKMFKEIKKQRKSHKDATQLISFKVDKTTLVFKKNMLTYCLHFLYSKSETFVKLSILLYIVDIL